MSFTEEFILLDLMPLTASVLAALSCGLIGNFLVLRREAMLGDAISHSVLPGLVLVFLLLGTAGTLPMLIGAALSGLLCALLVNFLQKSTRLEAGASIGVVFTILFAIGVLLIELFARHTHIDAECVLFGNVEYLSPWSPNEPIPRQIRLLVASLLACLLLVAVLFKELRLACFDGAFATAIGFRAGLLNLLLMSAVAFAVVAAFEAVGSILVVAMLVCPAACARLLTDRLLAQLLVSAAVSVVIAVAGYFAATRGLAWVMQDEHAVVQVAGMMASLSGLAVLLSVIGAPRRGVIARARTNASLQRRIIAEDVLGMLYRVEEAGGLPGLNGNGSLEIAQFTEALCTTSGERRRLARGLSELVRISQIQPSPGTPTRYELTPAGRHRARSLVRTHRLWESYLVHVLGLRADHVHRTAEQLEHLTTRQLARALELRVQTAGGSIDVDPHDRPIPSTDKD